MGLPAEVARVSSVITSDQRGIRIYFCHAYSHEAGCWYFSLDFNGQEILAESRCSPLNFECNRSVEGDALNVPREKAPAMSSNLLFCERSQLSHTLLNRRRRHRRFSVHGPASRSRPWREWEQMQIAEGQVANQLASLLEFAVRFSREAGHDICAEGEVRTRGRE